MRVTQFGTTRLVTVNIKKYLIKWHQPSASKIQTNTKAFLYNYWKGHLVLEEFKIPGCKLRCDIVNLNKKIAIEVHGDQHFDYNSFFHGSRTGYSKAIKRDVDKYKWLEYNGFRVIELDTEDVCKLTVAYIKEKFGILIV